MVLSPEGRNIVSTQTEEQILQALFPKARTFKIPKYFARTSGCVLEEQCCETLCFTTEFHIVLILTVWGLYALSSHETETAAVGEEIGSGISGALQAGPLCHPEAKEGRPLELGW